MGSLTELLEAGDLRALDHPELPLELLADPRWLPWRQHRTAVFARLLAKVLLTHRPRHVARVYERWWRTSADYAFDTYRVVARDSIAVVRRSRGLGLVREIAGALPVALLGVTGDQTIYELIEPLLETKQARHLLPVYRRFRELSP